MTLPQASQRLTRDEKPRLEQPFEPSLTFPPTPSCFSFPASESVGMQGCNSGIHVQTQQGMKGRAATFFHPQPGLLEGLSKPSGVPQDVGCSSLTPFLTSSTFHGAHAPAGLVWGNMSPPSPAVRLRDSLFILVKCFTQIIISKVNIVKIQIICSRNERITAGAHQRGGSALATRGFLPGYWEPNAPAPGPGWRWPELICKINFRQNFSTPSSRAPNEIWELIKNLTNCGGKNNKDTKGCRVEPRPAWGAGPHPQDILTLDPVLSSLWVQFRWDGCHRQAPARGWDRDLTQDSMPGISPTSRLPNLHKKGLNSRLTEGLTWLSGQILQAQTPPGWWHQQDLDPAIGTNRNLEPHWDWI